MRQPTLDGCARFGGRGQDIARVDITRRTTRGFPSQTHDHMAPPIDLNRLIIRNVASTFLARVRGASGLPDEVSDGDVAVIDRSLTPAIGDLVVVADGEGLALRRLDRFCENVWGVVTMTLRRFLN